ncbi:hypothetical protein CYMTET_5600 [Cymbomonas tetramitiformis]|uniref:Uncharacterized protein n=1 Tax=Cymbomonas tetramitiformis TaxID=36881 RepID=A0AAE0GYV8_9CHLO|nr:hypothetical protein CYMTET_5600 [Cymbomonas tetramitiformis]
MRETDNDLLLLGDGLVGLYAAGTAPAPKVVLRGVELRGLGSGASPLHSAIHADATASALAAAGGKAVHVELEGCVAHQLGGPCFTAVGHPSLLRLEENVCIGAVSTGVGLYPRLSALGPAEAKGATMVLQRNLVAGLQAQSAELLGWRDVAPFAYRLLLGSSRARIASNAALAGVGGGIAAPAGTALDNSATIETVQGASQRRAGNATRCAPQRAWEKPPPGVPPSVKYTKALHGGEEGAQLLLPGRQGALKGMGTNQLQYFRFEVPPSAARVTLVVQAVEGTIQALLNPWGGLPCADKFEGCKKNPYKQSPKQYSQGLEVRAPQSAPWSHPNYNTGEWYLGLAGSPGAKFTVSLDIAECLPGAVGFYTKRAKGEAPLQGHVRVPKGYDHRCRPAQELPLNQPLGGVHLSAERTAAYFYVDVPARAGSLYTMVNLTSSNGSSTIQWQQFKNVMLFCPILGMRSGSASPKRMHTSTVESWVWARLGWAHRERMGDALKDDQRQQGMEHVRRRAV